MNKKYFWVSYLGDVYPFDIGYDKYCAAKIIDEQNLTESFRKFKSTLDNTSGDIETNFLHKMEFFCRYTGFFKEGVDDKWVWYHYSPSFHQKKKMFELNGFVYEDK